MKIAATPMCQEILRLAGVSEYEIINDNDYDPVDILFTLSETKITLDSSVKYVKLKLNTFPQIIESIKLISEMLGTEPLNENLNHISTDHHKEENKKMHLKVYTNFLREIVEDM
ncbi:MAG TPA: hypothetical protein VMC48_00930, partial [Methanobacterium sp.]|nr:hypothetical protein [Methanobacterium sp.]